MLEQFGDAMRTLQCLLEKSICTPMRETRLPGEDPGRPFAAAGGKGTCGISPPHLMSCCPKDQRGLGVTFCSKVTPVWERLDTDLF